METITTEHQSTRLNRLRGRRTSREAFRSVLIWIALAGLLVASFWRFVTPLPSEQETFRRSQQQAADQPVVSVIRVEPPPPLVTSSFREMFPH